MVAKGSHATGEAGRAGIRGGLEIHHSGAGIPVRAALAAQPSGGIIPPEDARALKQFGVAAVYTPKDFKITEIMGDLVDIVEARVEQLV